jgi:hypothetical protein
MVVVFSLMRMMSSVITLRRCDLRHGAAEAVVEGG